MKASAVALAVILASLVSAHAVTTNQQAFTYFTDASGNVGFAYVTRQTDPTTNLTTTTLYYSFCVQTTAASCQEGSGVIPNSARRPIGRLITITRTKAMTSSRNYFSTNIGLRAPTVCASTSLKRWTGSRSGSTAGVS
jgi:hypothetical protein